MCPKPRRRAGFLVESRQGGISICMRSMIRLNATGETVWTPSGRSSTSWPSLQYLSFLSRFSSSCKQRTCRACISAIRLPSTKRDPADLASRSFQSGSKSAYGAAQAALPERFLSRRAAL
jgi:hypothetical protein